MTDATVLMLIVLGTWLSEAAPDLAGALTGMRTGAGSGMRAETEMEIEGGAEAGSEKAWAVAVGELGFRVLFLAGPVTAVGLDGFGGFENSDASLGGACLGGVGELWGGVFRVVDGRGLLGGWF
ncbi:hypothetical protein [Streptomyces sp. NPDC002403]